MNKRENRKPLCLCRTRLGSVNMLRHKLKYCLTHWLQNRFKIKTWVLIKLRQTWLGPTITTMNSETKLASYYLGKSKGKRLIDWDIQMLKMMADPSFTHRILIMIFQYFTRHCIRQKWCRKHESNNPLKFPNSSQIRP